MDGEELSRVEEEGARNPIPPALQRVLLAVYLAYTLFAVAVWVQFVRKLKSFYLTRRFTYMALLQISACLVAWTSFLVIIFAERSTLRCFCDFVIGMVATNISSLTIFIRVWGLFWRIFLGQFLSESRKNILTGSTSSIASDVTPLPKLHGILSKKARLNLLQLGLPAIFTALAIVHAIASLVSFSLNNEVLCAIHGESYLTTETASTCNTSKCRHESLELQEIPL